MVKASSQLIRSVSPLMLATVEQQVSEKKFSAGFTPELTARLNALKEVLPKPSPN